MVDVSFRLNRSQWSVGKNFMLIEWVYTFVVSKKTQKKIIPCSLSAECNEMTERLKTNELMPQTVSFSGNHCPHLNPWVISNLSGCVYI